MTEQSLAFLFLPFGQVRLEEKEVAACDHADRYLALSKCGETKKEPLRQHFRTTLPVFTVFSVVLQVVDCRICGDPNSTLRFAFVEFTTEGEHKPFFFSALLLFWHFDKTSKKDG